MRYVERVAKGFANHHRLKILLAVQAEPGLTLLDITDKLNINFRTVSEHSKKLVAARLISKRYRGKSVQHEITDLGRDVLKFCKKL